VKNKVLVYYPAQRGGVVFRGHQLLHWREAMSAGGPVVHALFHYVERDGLCRSWAYDRRAQGATLPEKTAPC
jgi:hypothetical protein